MSFFLFFLKNGHSPKWEKKILLSFSLHTDLRWGLPEFLQRAWPNSMQSSDFLAILLPISVDKRLNQNLKPIWTQINYRARRKQRRELFVPPCSIGKHAKERLLHQLQLLEFVKCVLPNRSWFFLDFRVIEEQELFEWFPYPGDREKVNCTFYIWILVFFLFFVFTLKVSSSDSYLYSPSSSYSYSSSSSVSSLE